MKDQSRDVPKITANAERKMQAWSFSEDLADRALSLDQAGQVSQRLGSYITISRQAGCHGEEVAELVGECLGWEVLGRTLLDRVAERYRLSREMLELVDETESNWAYDLLGAWLDPRIIPHEKYVVHLTRIVLAAAKRGQVVFVGRGVTFLLPRQQGLAVRLIGTEKFRLERIQQHYELSASDAKRKMTELDRGRDTFCRRFFQNDVADPNSYDLVLNVGRLGPEATADLIAQASRRISSPA